MDRLQTCRIGKRRFALQAQEPAGLLPLLIEDVIDEAAVRTGIFRMMADALVRPGGYAHWYHSGPPFGADFS